MKRAAITGVKEYSLLDIDIPAPKENWVLVKVKAIPLCTQYKGWMENIDWMTGHEAAGEVVELGPRSTKRKVGDRVVVMPLPSCGKCELCIQGEYIHCQTRPDIKEYTGFDKGDDTHVQYLVKPDWMLVSIPDGISYERASLACCGLGPTFGAMERFGAGAFDTVLITGAGPVGLGGVINAKYRGCKAISVELTQYRRDLAKELGADLVLDGSDPELAERIKAYTKGKGVDIAIETSGSNPGARTCIDALRRRGNMAFVGENGDLTVNVSKDFIRKGISVHGQWHYNLNSIPRIMEVIVNSPVVDKLITHRFPMSKINDAMTVCASQKCGKVMIDPEK